MILPDAIRRALLRFALWYSARRPPDNPIRDDYLHRWYITPWSGLYRDIEDADLTRWQRFVRSLPGIYLHFFYSSDYAKALHDHPWSSLSVILDGGYFEHQQFGTVPGFKMGMIIWRPPGSVIYRSAETLHRIEKPDGVERIVTLFITGRRRRQWGFDCKEGWRSYPEWEKRGGCD